MISKILVGTDGSDQADKAFQHALTLAGWSGAELHVVAVVYGPDIEMAEAEERENLVSRAKERFSAHLSAREQQARDHQIKLQTHLLEGHPVERLLELAWNENFDHIVVGHRSKGLFERLLMGSVAKRVVDFARCSVTVVR